MTERHTQRPLLEDRGSEQCVFKARNAKDGQQAIGSWKEARKSPPLRVSGGAWTSWHLDLGLLTSRTVRG